MFKNNHNRRPARKSIAAGIILLLAGLSLFGTGCRESNTPTDLELFCQWAIPPYGQPCDFL